MSLYRGKIKKAEKIIIYIKNMSIRYLYTKNFLLDNIIPTNDVIDKNKTGPK